MTAERDRARPPSSPPPRPPDPETDLLLGHAVRAALHALSWAVHPTQHRNGHLDGQRAGHGDRSSTTSPARVEQYLRAALAVSPAAASDIAYGEAAAAVGAACADLAAGDVAGAYLALHAADTALSEAARDPAPPAAGAQEPREPRPER